MCVWLPLVIIEGTEVRNLHTERNAQREIEEGGGGRGGEEK